MQDLRYQTATEMLRDLSRAIKNPDSNFVTVDNGEKEFEIVGFVKSSELIWILFSHETTENSINGELRVEMIKVLFVFCWVKWMSLVTVTV